MCVIMVVDDTLPSRKMLSRAEDENSDGAGIAWVQNGVVHWKKGLTAKGVYSIARSVPRPSVIHFRWSTVGGKNAELCHPFALDASVSQSLKGKSERVIFHNGHWGKWEKSFEENFNKIPSGTYSDSRMIAFLAQQAGPNYPKVLDDVGDKFCVLDKIGFRIFGFGWTKVDGVLCSNDYFLWDRKWMYGNDYANYADDCITDCVTMPGVMETPGDRRPWEERLDKAIKKTWQGHLPETAEEIANAYDEKARKDTEDAKAYVREATGGQTEAPRGPELPSKIRLMQAAFHRYACRDLK